MEVKTVALTAPDAHKGEADQVFMIDVTGPFDRSSKLLQEARKIVRETGSSELLRSFDRSVEAREFAEKQ
jgi:hypothetical protein